MNKLIGQSTWIRFASALLTTACCLTLAVSCLQAEQNRSASQSTSTQTASDTTSHDALATTFAKLIESAIPVEYDKKKDWGKTKNLTVGLHNKGLKIKRRKKAVKHGVWKHYRVKLVNPEEKFAVRIDNLRSVDDGRFSFTLVILAKLDTWIRAKVYQYGVHLIAVEITGDTEMELSLDCEVGVQLRFVDGLPSVTIDPRVANSHLALSNFHLRRISNAKGPLVKELSSGLRRVIEHELKGPKLTAKLNRAIDRKRDRLELSMSELVDSSWWPLARLPELEQATRSR